MSSLQTVKNSPLLMAVFERIARERFLQRSRFLSGITGIELSSPVTDSHRKLRRLVQNIGAVGDMLERFEHSRDGFENDRLREALTSLAANTAGWLEALEPVSAPRAGRVNPPVRRGKRGAA